MAESSWACRSAAAGRGMMHYGLFGMARDLGSGLYEWVISLCCTVGCTSSTVEVGERTLKVVRQLAEGGFCTHMP